MNLPFPTSIEHAEATAPAASAAPERFHALDALRAFAMLLGIYLHAAVPYMMARPYFWPEHLNDPHQSLAHDLAVFFIHCFRMELFFLMAGFFGHLVLQRRGVREFLKHRGVRIGIPLMVGWGLMIVLLPLSVGWRPFTDPRFYLPAHLWFLYYLLVYCAGAAAVVAIWPVAGEFAREPGMLQRLLARVIRWPAQALGMSLLTVPLLLTMQTPVVDTPLAFFPIPRVAAYYAVFFTVGWMIHRQMELLAAIERWRWVSLIGALLLAIPLLVLVEIAIQQMGGTMRPDATLALTPKVLLLRTVYGVFTWFIVFGTTGFFMRHLRGHHPAVRYVADSAYWLYIMHLPLVLFLQWQLAGNTWIPGPLKICVIIGLSVVVLLATYQLFVRHTLIGRVLNGGRGKR